MRSSLTFMFISLLWAHAACAEEQGPGQRPVEETIRDLVKQLADEEFSVREKADKELRGRGVAAVKALEAELAKAKDIEVARRICNILDEYSFLVIAVDATGKTTIRGEELTKEALKQAADARRNELSGLSELSVCIKAHPGAAYRYVQEAMVTCMKAGVHKVFFDEKLDEKQTHLPVEEAWALEKPEEIAVFIQDDLDERAKNNSDRKAKYFLASRDATPTEDTQVLLPRLKALAQNPEQEVLIALFDEQKREDHLVPFGRVLDLIKVCKEAGIRKIKFQAPAILKK